MKNLFNSVKMTRPDSNVFDLSHDVKLSCGMGTLVPIMVMDCVPGDKVTIGCESLLRFAPLIAPLMHRLDVTMHYFFVPNRILWNNWEKFITNTPLTSTGLLPAHPYITITDDAKFGIGTLTDYMGFPPAGSIQSRNVNPLAFAAYQKVYNDYYRDQNLIDDLFPDDEYPLTDGANVANLDKLITLRRRAWEHDYFTAALPFAQKGSPVDIPLGNVELNPDSALAGRFVRASDHTYSDVGDVVTTGVEPNANITIDGIGQVYDPKDTLTVGSTTINDLRRAFRLQEWLEKAARGGSRYIESILMHFGVRSSDKRLQRPEYITGVKSPVVISEVLNTTGNTGELPQGNMAGHAVGVTSGKYGSYYCEEHGYIIGIMSVMPKTAYTSGVDKHWLKINDPFEHFWPSFQNIGEQAINTREVNFWNETDDVFGYVPRYAEYKFINNRVCGAFRTNLAFWHMGREFLWSTPTPLNKEFVECKPRTDVFAVETDEHELLYVHVLNKVRAVRKMSKYGSPSF